MKDSVSKGVYLVATVFAFVAFTATDTIVAWVGYTAFSTSR